MAAFITPHHDTCASCEIQLAGWPVYRTDEGFCCSGCADGGPCICSYDADQADDGVDGLGLPFHLPFTGSEQDLAPSRDAPPVTALATSSRVASRS